MREIKFRAWHILGKVMYGPTDLDAYSLAVFRHPESPFIFMQYTGLKDKNGKEIYEGDILHDSYLDLTWTYAVTWDRYSWYPFTSTTWTANQLEVIGNIYQNPELLEGA